MFEAITLLRGTTGTEEERAAATAVIEKAKLRHTPMDMQVARVATNVDKIRWGGAPFPHSRLT